ncbi:DNA-protecting protein DprA [Roseiconus nitratireducens]|uniref:DNA-protecting protein DprA n=1 Tax=Roseiconus nitratireducens TaxID=2605748 RepID=A0A5M6D618_9BACT|nr:DNA-processing protein DprA [Roseiconus nitratireducens]KAA5542186.1 DNA-protecting protein DprA [Roseiconus nitratireducens]
MKGADRTSGGAGNSSPPPLQPAAELRGSQTRASIDKAERLRDALTLSLLPGLGPRTQASLLEVFGDPGNVLQADESSLMSVPGVGPKLVHTIRTAAHHVDPQGVLDWCRQNDCQVLLRGSDAYPNLLNDLDDAPSVLFCRGTMLPCDEIAVAIVGTRHATAYGTRQAERMAFALASAGVTVVSGLARGIDAAAHQGALSAGGRTVAVLGGGLGQIYPAEHAPLADSIADQGAVVSEFAPQAKPRGGMFPQRNRLIAALSLATLVVEAPDRSGALITARLAGELNRDCLAIPGPISSRASRGTNQLIRDGATLVQSVDDVLETLGPMTRAVKTSDGHEIRNPAELSLNDIERSVLECIQPDSTAIDRVIGDSKLPAHQVMATISVLEMRRLIRRLSGQYVSRI